MSKLVNDQLTVAEMSDALQLFDSQLTDENDFTDHLFDYDIEISKDLDNILTNNNKLSDIEQQKIFNVKKDLIEFTNLILKTELFESIEAEVTIIPSPDITLTKSWTAEEKRILCEILEYTPYDKNLPTILKTGNTFENISLILKALECHKKTLEKDLHSLKNDYNDLQNNYENILKENDKLKESLMIINAKNSKLIQDTDEIKQFTKIMLENPAQTKIFPSESVDIINDLLKKIPNKFIKETDLQLPGFDKNLINKIKCRVLQYGIDEKIIKLDTNKILLYFSFDKVDRQWIIEMCRLIFVIHYIIFDETGIVSWMKFGNTLSRKIFNVDFAIRTVYNRFRLLEKKTEYIINRRIRTFTYWSIYLPQNGLKMFNAGVKSKVYYLNDIQDNTILLELLDKQESSLLRLGSIKEKYFATDDFQDQILLIDEKDLILENN